MGGGLMQLVAYGAQDIYLTGNPQITFFKVVYRRHTNFSMESIKQTMAGPASPNSTQTCTVTRNGDLIHNVWIEETPTDAGKSVYDYIKDIECEIGGQLIDRQSGDWNAVWWNLTTPESKVNGLDNTLKGISGCSTTNNFYYPLNFWFCRNIGLALPLIALQYHEINLKVTYGATSQVTTPVMWIDYIFLDTDERRRFAQVSHEYLIEQIQRDTFPGNETTFNLKFNHPVKELIFVNSTGTNHSNEDSCIFSPIGADGDPQDPAHLDPYRGSDNTEMKLVLNGHDRFDKRNMKYFKTCQPLQHHTRCPSIGKTYSESVSAHFDHDSVIGLSNASATSTFKSFNATGLITNTNETILYGNASVPDGVLMQVNKPIRLLSTEVNTNRARFNASASLYLRSTWSPSSPANVRFNGTVSGSSLNHFTELAINPITINASDTATAGVGNSYSLKSDHSVCIPADQYLGYNCSYGFDTNASSESWSGVFTFKYEELPTLIGGIKSNLGNIYCYSFALRPEEHQPSGTCNFSRIDNAQLVFDSSPGHSNSTLKVFAVNYNVLRIMSGMGGLAYSN